MPGKGITTGSRLLVGAILVAALALAIHSFGLRGSVEKLEQQCTDLESQLALNKEWAEEKKRLSSKFSRRERKLDYERYNTVERVCNLLPDVDEFPVRDGEYLARGLREVDDGFDLGFFVPAGKHSLVVTTNYINNETRGWGANPRKVTPIRTFQFHLPPAAVGQLQFRLSDQDDQTTGTFVLIGSGGKQIASTSMELVKRKLSGFLSSTSNGKVYRIPGELDCNFMRTTGHGSWKHQFHHEDNRVTEFNVTYRIHSPDAPPFLHARDAANGLSRFNGQSSSFADYFEPGLRGNKFVMNRKYIAGRASARSYLPQYAVDQEIFPLGMADTNPQSTEKID